MSASVEFETAFSDSLIADAADAVSRRILQGQLTLLIRLALVVNFATFLAVVFVFGNEWITWLWGALAVALPLYWPASFVLRRRRLRRQFMEFRSGTRFAVHSDGFSVISAQGSTTIPWTDLLQIVELRRYFLLMVRWRHAILVMPSERMPAAAKRILVNTGLLKPMGLGPG